MPNDCSEEGYLLFSVLVSPAPRDAKLASKLSAGVCGWKEWVKHVIQVRALHNFKPQIQLHITKHSTTLHQHHWSLQRMLSLAIHSMYEQNHASNFLTEYR